MKKTIAATALAATTASAAFAGQALELFVSIHSAGAMAQGAGLVLATKAREQDASVRVLLCDAAADLALKEGAPDTRLKPMDATPQQMLQGLIKIGATVEVCALYLPNKGLKADALLPGVAVGKPADVASYILKPGVRTLAF